MRGQEVADKIVLAHEAPFPLGPLAIRPSTRTILHERAEIVVEPRVMQVLVALARANGTVVSRDDLVETCWEGRIVGDDAVNRVLSRLRRLSEETRHAFAIETITRVGYRLLPAAPPAPDAPAPATAGAPAPLVSRRAALALGVGGAALAAGGSAWFALRPAALPPAAQAALDRGRSSLHQNAPDETSAAVAAFREAAALAPRAAEPWGMLALAYRQQLNQRGDGDAGRYAELEARTREAAGHALERDPDNADAACALASLMPVFRNWLTLEARCRVIEARHPENGMLNTLYGTVLAQVGRGRAALARIRRAVADDPMAPPRQSTLVAALQIEGRLDEADAVMAQAFALWPRHYSIWFTRQRLLAYTGRGPAALAMLADTDTRPIAIPDSNFAMTEAETRAVMTRTAADIARASQLLIDAAHHSTGFAENAIKFHIAVGQIDTAYRLIDAYFFDRGFAVGATRYSKEQGLYQARRERKTFFLLTPQAAALRADSRFPALTRTLGLATYWARSGSRPDYWSYRGETRGRGDGA